MKRMTGPLKAAGDDAGFAQQQDPAERADEIADPQRDEAHEKERAARALTGDLRDVVGDGKPDQQRQNRHQQGHGGRAQQRVPVDRLVEEVDVVGRAELIDARPYLLAQRYEEHAQVRQDDEQRDPERERREEQEEREALDVLVHRRGTVIS
ncbi:MAG: hypothetical protein P8X75_09975 [Limibacillus sp.]